MSAGAAIPIAEARAGAAALVAVLADACERIEIAGSIRRHRPEVHDIEIVAIPTRSAEGGLWGDAQLVDRLEERIVALRADGEVSLRAVEMRRADGTVEVSHRDGSSYKALAFRGVPVDLFITDAERWGCIFALRTGPGDWNTRLVTDCKHYFRRVENGRVLHLGRPIATPEEADFFRALGVPWVEPQDRRVDALWFDPRLFA